MSSSWLLQQCPTSLIHLIWMVLKIGSRWPYKYCFVGCCFQDLFNITHSILVQFQSSLFSIHFISVHVVHPYSRLGTAALWKKSCFILFDRLDFLMIDNLSTRLHAFPRSILISHSIDEMLLPRYMKFSSHFREPPLRVKTSPF